MRKQQFIHLLQFVFAWVLIRAFVVFVMEESFVDFVLKYWLYFLIVSISYFYYYSIQYEPDKKYKLIRNVLIYGNAYLFLHMFFRPQLNISHQLFVLLWLIALWVWWTTKLKTRWKYLLQIIGWIFSFFILISGMFYFYPDPPDIKWFLNSRNTQLRVLWVDEQIEKSDAYIKMGDLKGSNDFVITPNFSKILSDNVKISYPSLNKDRDERLVIIGPQWDLVWIFPQSEVDVQISWNILKSVKKINWKVWFLSWIFDSDVEIFWSEKYLSPEEQNWLEWAQDTYKYDVVSYLKSQISESKIGLANNTIMYNIDGKIIKYLSKMFPVTFGDNLQNYNEFQKYFEWLEWSEVDLGRFSMQQLTWESINSFWWWLKDNVDAWKDNTYGWFKKPENR